MNTLEGTDPPLWHVCRFCRAVSAAPMHSPFCSTSCGAEYAVMVFWHHPNLVICAQPPDAAHLGPEAWRERERDFMAMERQPSSPLGEAD